MYGSVVIDDPEEIHPLGNRNPYTPRYPYYHFDNSMENVKSENQPTTEL